MHRILGKTMRSFYNLFGRSPFAPIQGHMDLVTACVHLLPHVFSALKKGDYTKVEQLSQEITKHEHNADIVKGDIRNRLPASLFLPVDRGNLLEILTLQDSIADKAEDIAILTTLKPLKFLDPIQDTFQAFLDKNLETFEDVRKIISEIDELLETSFGGVEAEKVRAMVDDVAYKEHQADLIQRDLLKAIFRQEKDVSISSFYLWQKIIEALGSISNLSENLAYRVRTTLELK